MKRLRFLLIIPLFLAFVLVYVIGNNFLRRDEPLIHNYIPDEVDVLVEFDIKHFGSAFMYNMLYNSEYFNEKIPLPPIKERKQMPSMGVSYTHNFVFALERWGTGDFYYFIFELRSKDDFDAFMVKLRESNENVVAISNHEVGILGFANNVDKGAAEEYLGEVINKNVESIRTKYDLFDRFNWDRDLNMHFNTQAFVEGSKLEDIFASIDLVGTSAIMDVEYISNQEYNVAPLEGKILSPKSLHMSSTMKFEDILSTFGIKDIKAIKDLPAIKKWSINNLGSKFEMQSGVKKDSINEIMKIESPGQAVSIDSKGKFGVYIEKLRMKVAFNSEDKFEFLLEPVDREKFESFMIDLADSNVIVIDSSKSTIDMGQLGVHRFKWVENNFIIYPLSEDKVELVEVTEQGSYYYMNFDINDFFENFTLEGDGSFFTSAGVGYFKKYKKKISGILKNFNRIEVSLFEEDEKIKIHSDMSFKNTEGVAIIEMMSAFMNSNFTGFSFGSK